MFYWDDGDQYFQTIQEACEHFETDEEKVPEFLEVCERVQADSFIEDAWLQLRITDLIERIEEDVCELSNESWGFGELLSDEAEGELLTFLRRWVNAHYHNGKGILSPTDNKVPFKPIYAEWLKRYDENGEPIESPCEGDD